MNNLRIGELLVKHKLLTVEQLIKALEQQPSHPNKTLGQMLCQMGLVNKNDLDVILDHYQKRQKLGQILIKQKIIDERKLEHALAVSKKEKALLGDTLMKLNYIEEQTLAQSYASQYDMPFVSLANIYVSPEMAKFIKPSFAIHHKIVTISKVENSVTVAMAFPLEKQLFKDIQSSANITIVPVIAMESEIIQVQKRLYRKSIESKSGQDDLQIEIFEDVKKEKGPAKSVEEANSPEAERLVRKIIALGVKAKTSDIHLECADNGMNVRYRIDGMLQKLDLKEDAGAINNRAQMIISRIKILCNMDIAEKRRPQDGSFRMRVGNFDTIRVVDFRVSSLPTDFGEDMVIRVLDKGMLPMSLQMLGFTPDQLESIHAALETPSGLFLVTGPTGCGKSATLHALLLKVNRPNLKSLTVEDPIEYTIKGVRQTEVNEAVGNNFARLIRSFMRQDPDNIMIGEIRDIESGSLAIKAALSGHTVMSSLQTNDATSTVTNLLHMGIDPSYIISTLRCIIAQRLVRTTCEHCRTPYTPEPQTLRQFLVPPPPGLIFSHGIGCAACNFTGFSGRRPISEIWIPTAEELLMIYERPDNITLRQHVFIDGRRQTMIQDGIARVWRNETTLEELLRIVPYAQLAEIK